MHRRWLISVQIAVFSLCLSLTFKDSLQGPKMFSPQPKKTPKKNKPKAAMLGGAHTDLFEAPERSSQPRAQLKIWCGNDLPHFDSGVL